MVDKTIVCNEKGKCFAQINGLDGRKLCTLLTHNYPEGHCKFCKPFADITNGKFYEYKANYGKI